jgi:hypothetical protein
VPVKLGSFLFLMLYVAYMVQVGLILLVVPWSEPWPLLMVRLPPRAAFLLDQPALRGLISGIGALHLLAVVLELAPPALRRWLAGDSGA